MNEEMKCTTKVRVDPTNPGQFLACCGLLELADRLWNGAQGWFNHSINCFYLKPIRDGSSCDHSLLRKLTQCTITNTMTSSEIKRREELLAMQKKVREDDKRLEAEKKHLDELWRESPLLFEPIGLRLDWFADKRTGGSVFKTWAGQQSVVDIAMGLKSSFESNSISEQPDSWLSYGSVGAGLPFYFDSNLGNMGSDLDVGFSLDPLAMQMRTRPVVELAAFIGLQRFRPVRIAKENRFQYSLWLDPLVPEIAAAAACGIFRTPESQTFEFSLQYRTKYLKSFLPAIPIERRR
jgi:CRISPR-associated protein Csb3